MENIKKTLLWISLFAVAMGFLEASVVIYLRELYYNTGFNFPLKPVPNAIARTEFSRELATLIMLIGCGIIAGKTRMQRFAFFVLAFAIWDIFYYVFLYLCIGWPQSLNTWDILFLIPVPWVGPVWAPCLLSALMIMGSVFIIFRIHNDKLFRVPVSKTVWIIFGALICIVAFMWDYLVFTANRECWSPASPTALFTEIAEYVPTTFNYPLFFAGFFCMCVPLILLIFNSSRSDVK